MNITYFLLCTHWHTISWLITISPSTSTNCLWMSLTIWFCTHRNRIMMQGTHVGVTCIGNSTFPYWFLRCLPTCITVHISWPVQVTFLTALVSTHSSQCQYFAVASMECYTPKLWMMVTRVDKQVVGCNFHELYYVKDGCYTLQLHYTVIFCTSQLCHEQHLLSRIHICTQMLNENVNVDV